MTHQPPIPAAATPPYPHVFAPHDENHASPSTPANAAEAGYAGMGSRWMLGIGAAVGVAAVTLAARVIRRRRTPTARGAPKKRSSADRARVARTEPYEVTYFARKHRITAAQARAIIAEAGPSRARANELATQRQA